MSAVKRYGAADGLQDLSFDAGLGNDPVIRIKLQTRGEDGWEIAMGHSWGLVSGLCCFVSMCLALRRERRWFLSVVVLAWPLACREGLLPYYLFVWHVCTSVSSLRSIFFYPCGFQPFTRKRNNLSSYCTAPTENRIFLQLYRPICVYVSSSLYVRKGIFVLETASSK